MAPLFLAMPATAAEATETATASAQTRGEIAADAAAPATEATPAACRDGIDNDGDGHVDCDDQDCEIFAVCVTDPEQTSAAPAAPPAPQGVTRVTVFESHRAVEQGRRCRDGIDNDDNGRVDCEEPQCRRSRYCRQVMYHYPDDDTRPPGMFVSVGFGLAAPNYRYPHAETDSVYGTDISFDPDLGAMLDLQLGFMAMKYIGGGLNLKAAVTGAGNHDADWFSRQTDEEYKFIGMKLWSNIGGFVRLQWPFERFVPFVNIHFGYSASRHRWHIYDEENSWEDIVDHEADDTSYLVGERDERKSGVMRHFTFALEPGFNVFVAKRRFGVGMKAWLPVAAGADAETDNVGVLIDFIFTPQWRGPKQLKEKYKHLD